MSPRKFRFFAKQIDPVAPFPLADFEIPHIQRSLRLKPGTEVEVFDANGQRCKAKLHSLSQRQILCQFLAETSTELEPLNLILAVAPPKNKRTLYLVEKLTELNIRTFIPLMTERGEWQAKQFPKANAAWHRRSIEACKQCHRDRSLEIREPLTVQQLIASEIEARKAFGAPCTNALDMTKMAGKNSPALIAIGPEGGWSHSEFTAFRENHWQACQIGQTVLRVETAALAFAAVFAAHYQ